MDNGIYEVLESLTDELKTAKRAMFGGGKILDEVLVAQYVTRIEENLPKAVKDAQFILKDREKLMAEAEEKANQILDKAEEEALKMIAEHNITAAAKAEAERLMDKAEKYAAMLDYETKKRIDKLFLDSEDRLVEILQVIRSCREELMGTMLKKD